MKSREIRESFIDYFKNKYKHTYVPSSSLILMSDPTLLFANAGMNQFKDIFLNLKKPDYTRAVNSQRCIRVSGKHNDLEEVGRDTYHHTFFEMLGNWSFGDYYKPEAIKWAWELLTGEWKIPKDRLHATVFGGDKARNIQPDSEAFETWKKVTDINEKHIHYFGAKDNFWMMGPTGPCGPCTEIHIDLTPDKNGGHLVNAGTPQVIELWNLVFILFNANEDGSMSDLADKHIDTGMGFERVTAVLQNKESNYDSDIFTPLIDAIADLTSTKYTREMEKLTDIALRVIADHIRMSSFAISDGALPSNKGRGYVIRGIIRRMVRYYYQHLKRMEPFAYKLVPIVMEQMGSIFPSILENGQKVSDIIQDEERDFLKTIDKGIAIFNEAVDHAKKNHGIINGEAVFNLYTTYGFPHDLTRQMALEQNVTIDEKQFEEMMDEHRSISSSKAKFKGGATLKGDVPATYDSLKYTTDECSSSILGWILDNEYITEGKLEPQENVLLILDKTCFFAESGGQVGDIGSIKTDTGVFTVLNTIKAGNSIYHTGTLQSGYFAINQKAAIAVDPARFQIRRNHTSTHLLHYALQKVVGDSTEQQGSRIKPDSFTFDFYSKKPVTPAEIKTIEEMVNALVVQNLPVTTKVMDISDAKKLGNVKAFFGDKYEDVVRVIEIGDGFSREFCGGTHVKNTGDIGTFLILKEEGIAKGIRRISGVTGKAALSIIQEQRAVLDSITAVYKCPQNEIIENIESSNKKIKELETQLKQLSRKELEKELESLYQKSTQIKGVNVIITQMNTPFDLWEALSTITNNHSKVVIVIGNIKSKDNLELVGAASGDLKDCGIDCKKIIAEASKIVNGNGGGSALKARGGGSLTGQLTAALQRAEEIIASDLK